jgi:tetratricopeptide (TPR) repeat protein
MQDFLQGNFDETNEALARFEVMNSGDRELYFDVHQVESLFEHYLDHNQFELAEKILLLGIKQHPTSLSLQIKETILLSERGEYDLAIEKLEKYQNIEENSAEIAMTLGWLYLKKGWIIDTLTMFDKAILFAFDEKENYLLDIGFNLNQEGWYEEAIPFLEQGVKLAPANDSLLFELAFAYDKTDMIDEGIEAYAKLLSINPFFENAWYNLGILHNKKNQFEEAVQAYEYSIAINPSHSESYFNMGNSFAHLNRFQEALECYLEYASFGSDNQITHQYIGECWEQLEQPAKAIEFYELVIRTNPDSGDAWYGIGTAMMAENRFEESFAPLQKALKLHPDNPDYWFAFARACYETQRIEEAIRSLENGISFDPEEISAWIELVQMHMKHSENFDFLQFIAQSLEKYPSVAAVSYMAAVIHFYYDENKGEALTYLKIAKRRQPEDMEVVLAEFPELLSSPEIVKYINHKVKNVNR